MNQPLSMGALLPSRHHRRRPPQKRPAAQAARGEDLLHGTHQMMKGMRGGAAPKAAAGGGKEQVLYTWIACRHEYGMYCPLFSSIHPLQPFQPRQQPQPKDVTAAWRTLLLPPTGPGGRSSRKALPQSQPQQPRKGVSASPLYILASQQSPCGMLLRSLDDSLRHLLELIDRLPAPVSVSASSSSPSLLPASLISHAYLWHLSPPPRSSPSPSSTLAPAPHLAGAVHLATLHAQRLETPAGAGAAEGEWVGESGLGLFPPFSS